MVDTKTKKRIEVRCKKEYETNYDASDKLHQVLDSVGKAANISELMNGEVVGINPKHPQGADAEKTAKDVLTTESLDNIYESVLYYRQMKENLGEIAQATEIYVDMDGVLADFFGEWAKLMKVDHYSKIDKEHKIGDALQAIRDTDEFWLNLPMLPQAKQLLSVIKQIKGEYNICSSPLADDPNSEPHKREWIKKNLSFFPPKEVIITTNKPEYATQQDGTPNILIDDFGKNVSEWEAAGGTAFKYKDHKFERTANAIKQHMQEPVEESIIVEHPAVIAALYAAGTTVRELVKRYGLKSVRQALDKLKNQRANTQKPANDHGGPIDNIIAAVKKPRTSDEIARFQQQNLPRALDNAKAMIRHTSKDFKAGKLSREEFNKIMRYARHKFKNQTGKDLPIDDLLKLTEQETNKKTQDAATKKAKPYDLPIRPDIAELIVQAYPELKRIWVINDKYGIVGTKLKNGPTVFKLQRQLKKDGYPIKVDGKAGKDTDKMFKHWLGNVIYYLKHDYLNESITENFADGKKKGKSRPGRVKKSGASCNGSVTELRKKAKNASGEKAKMYHWCANMKSGRS